MRRLIEKRTETEFARRDYPELLWLSWMTSNNAQMAIVSTEHLVNEMVNVAAMAAGACRFFGKLGVP